MKHFKMENIWNKRNLCPPPVFTLKVSRHKINAADLRSICKELETIFAKKTSLIKSEAALLSCLIHRNKNQFRFDKGFQNLIKVKRCLQRYMEMCPIKILQNFSCCVPEEATGSFMYVPSRQMLQYVQVRLMGIAQLLQQTIKFCKTGGSFLLQRIRIGHSWTVSLMFLGIASRIWAVCRHWVWSVCQTYKNFQKFIPQLTSTDVSWLPDGFDLPTDLTVWVDAKNPKIEASNAAPSNRIMSNKIFDLLTEEGDDSMLIEVEAPSTTISKKVAKASTAALPSKSAFSGSLITSNEDLGESLSRTSHRTESKNNKQLLKQVHAICSLDDLIKFCEKELSGDKMLSEIRNQVKNLLKSAKKSVKKNNTKKTNELVEKAKVLIATKLS